MECSADGWELWIDRSFLYPCRQRVLYASAMDIPTFLNIKSRIA
jgi:hypothetical protein